MRVFSSIAIWLVRLYQVSLGLVLGGRCRFYPSCSNYAIDAFKLHPPHRAAWLATRRICRCHPLGGHGVDPVPEPRNNQVAKG
ncbi:MAG: membrane protein insertion efficiency factor YidD [Phycisphaerales bacterium]